MECNYKTNSKNTRLLDLIRIILRNKLETVNLFVSHFMLMETL